MTQIRNDDREFEELFGGFAPPLADDGFTDAVVRRVARTRWLRRAVLALAGATGGLVAAVPFAQVTNRLADSLVTIATRWNDAAWLAQNQEILIGALLIIATPICVRLLED